MDTISLYTVIPNGEGFQALNPFIDQRTVKEPNNCVSPRKEHTQFITPVNSFQTAQKYTSEISFVTMFKSIA